RLDTNEEFTAARKAEQNRQEAINQMYRLASFYRVSQGKMASAEEPVFPKMPDVGVPEPMPEAPFDPRGGQNAAVLGDVRTTPQGAPVSGVSAAGAGAEPTLGKETSELSSLPTQPVGTEINSGGTLPPQEAVRPNTGAAPPVPGGPAGQAGPAPPTAPSTVPPALRGAAGRPVGGPGGMPAGKVPPMAQGRAAGSGPNGPLGRMGQGAVNTGPGTGAAGPMGRATGPLGPVGRASMPGPASGTGNGPVGRGIVGGVPRSTAPIPGSVGGAPRGPIGPMGAAPAGRGGAV